MEMIVAFLLVCLVLVALSILQANSKKARILKQEYDQLLDGTDRRAALKAGRRYYSALRILRSNTFYDEMAIANDLSTMDAAGPNPLVNPH